MRITVLVALAMPLAAQSPRFVEHVIATGLKGGYQVVAADMNHDGRPDLIALASGMPDLVWYENPSWERHVIFSGLNHMINCAAEDIDGDGIPEIAIAWNFANDASKSIGSIGILSHDGDPRKPWKLRQIDELTTSHRLRWADIDGSSRKVLVVAPLTGAHAAPPQYKGNTPLVYYRPEDWRRVMISDANEGVQHGLFITSWRPESAQPATRAGVVRGKETHKRESILTASFSGIDLFSFNGQNWTRTEIATGDPSPCPKCGSSDIAVGYIDKQRFLAAIEPWHGNQVVVYIKSREGWGRRVIDDSLTQGHTLLTADFEGTGQDAIVAGFRGDKHGVFLYEPPSYLLQKKADHSPVGMRTPPTFPAHSDNVWRKTAIDSDGIAASSCAAVDLNGDGRPDLACIGSSTANLTWYENTGGAR